IFWKVLNSGAGVPARHFCAWLRELVVHARKWRAVGVGIVIAHDPLHGSGRAELPHPALASGDDAEAAQRVRMTDAGLGQPAFEEAPRPLPAHRVLTAPR